MPIRILGTDGDQTSLMEAGPTISLIRTFRGMDMAESPLGVTLYRNAVLSVANAAWVNVPFTHAIFPNVTYGVPIQWVVGTPADVLVTEDGWYMLSASIGFAAVAGVDINERFHFLIGAAALVGNQTPVPAAYTYQLSGTLVYWVAGGQVLHLAVSHSHSSAVNLAAGVASSSFMVTRISS